MRAAWTAMGVGAPGWWPGCAARIRSCGCGCGSSLPPAAAGGVPAPAAAPAAGAVAAAGGLREFERSKTVKTTV
jgi:hypothetical protein